MLKSRTLTAVLALVLASGAGAPYAFAQESAPSDTTTPAVQGPPPDWYNQDEAEDQVRGVSTAKAYRELLQGRQPRKTVTVAVIDSGIDIHHDDLDDRIWVNEDEVPANGIDDDQNGYVDDVHGWNFIGGPDGRNVDDDTYELTREYVRLRAEYAGVDPKQLSEEEQEEYAYYQQIQENFEVKRAELEEQIEMMRGAQQDIEMASGILKEFLGTDTLTAEQIRGVTSIRNDVRSAQKYLLYLDENGFTPEVIAEQVEILEDQYEHGYNPDFDPRSIVGDDYDDLNERYYGNPDVVGPDPSHGTSVAGVIGAERGNGIGFDGIAPDVRIMVVRVVPGGDERDKDVANGIRYAVDNGADIVNMSFGKSYSPHKAAVDAAARYAEERGVLLVHASGNSSEDLDVESNFPNAFFEDAETPVTNWIEVGASGPQPGEGLAADFSNYGQTKVDVFAPGVDIYSTKPGKRYSSSNGTSLSAPIVTGIAAMLEAYYPELTASQLRSIIMESATRYPGEKTSRPGDGDRVEFSQLSVTGGVANAYNALKMAQEMQAQ